MDKTTKTTPSNPFRELRERYGMSMERWAKAIGVTLNSVQTAEYGVRATQESLLAALRAAGIATDGLMELYAAWYAAKENEAAMELRGKLEAERNRP